MNIQGWFPFGLTGLISLLSKGLSRVFSGTTVRKHQFFSTQPSLWSNSHICTWLLEKLQLWLYRCPKTIKQWWHETHILPSELSRTHAPHTLKKQSFVDPAWPCRDKKNLLLILEEELMTETQHLLKKDKKGFLPLSTFPLIVKM